MDSEDRDHFKTIANQFPEQRAGSRNAPPGANKFGAPDQAWCLEMTQILFSCYRKDEAHDGDIYCAAVASVLAEYPREVVETVTDPRTGIASESKFLPSVAEVRSFCSVTAARAAIANAPRRPVKPYVPPPLPPGRINSTMHARLVAEGRLKSRPIGYFEKPGDEWNRGIK